MSWSTIAISQRLATYWRRSLHISWLLCWSSIATIAGIALAALGIYPKLACAQIATVSIMLMCVALMKSQVRIGLLAVGVSACLLLGLWRGENRRLEMAGYQALIGNNVEVQGTVADDVIMKGGVAGFGIRKVYVGKMLLSGQIWASSSTDLHLKRGDQIKITGTLRPGFGSYAASLSFAKVTGAIRNASSDPSRGVRDEFDKGLERTIPQPEAALAIGYLTGQHNMMPRTLSKQMQITGLIHLVIAGGYNVTILVRLVRRACARLAKKLALIISIGVLLSLTIVAGFVAPMARTTVVTGLCLASWYYGRWPHPIVLLSVAAAITAFINPSFVWGDVGWYMTFIAYGGLIILGPMLKKWWWGDSHNGELKQIIVDTIAVQIVATPLMSFAFQQYSIYGLPANLLVLPFMSLTMLAATIAGLGGILLPSTLAHWVSLPANVLLAYTHEVIVWMAGAPGANLGGGISMRGLVLSYVVIVVFIWRLKHKINYDFRSENPVE